MDFSLSSRSSFSQSQLTRDDLPHQTDDVEDVAMDAAPADAEVDEAARAKEEYRSRLRRRVAAYEQCVEAVGVLTASLEELSAKVEAMKTSTQQLNAFTSGWLTVWQRSATQVPTVTATSTTQRRPWNTSTRLTDHTSRDDSEKDNGQQRGDKKPSTTKQSHSRCTSPTCQRRRKAAVDMAIVPQNHTGLLDSPRNHQQHHNPNGQRQPRSESPEQNPTRAMIERAFDAAFVSTLEDPHLTVFNASVDTSTASRQQSPSHKPLKEMLRKADDAAKQWRSHYVRQREQKQRAANERLAHDTKVAEVQRVMRAARFEYEQRKLAMQSLQARVQREMQFLEATAAELARRDSLLDDAFNGYEQVLQRELQRNEGHHSAHAG